MAVPTSPGGTWKYDFETEDYDSDDSLYSFKASNEKIEDEVNAMDVEIGFKRIRAGKMFSDANAILRGLGFKEAQNYEDIENLIRLNQTCIKFKELPKDNEVVSLIGQSKNIVCLQIGLLTKYQVKMLGSILKVNTSIRMIVALKYENISEEVWDRFADELESNNSLLFFLESTKEKHFSKIETNFGLEKVRRILYRNQQLCESAYKSVGAGGERSSFRHCQITVLGGPATGKTSTVKKLFDKDPIDVDKRKQVSIKRFFVYPDNKRYHWTYKPAEENQYTSFFCHKVAADKVNEYVSEVNSSKSRRILEISEPQALAPISKQQSSVGSSILAKKSTNSNSKSKNYKGFSFKLFGRLSKTREDERQKLQVKPVRKPIVEDMRDHASNVSNSTSLDPTTGQRTVITKNVKPVAVDQVRRYYKNLDLYKINPTSQSLMGFDWVDMFSSLYNPERTLVSVMDFKSSNTYNVCAELMLEADKPSVVMICFNMANIYAEKREHQEKEVDTLLFWLKKVQKKSPKAAIYLVGTHINLLPNGTESYQEINRLLKRVADPKIYQNIVSDDFIFHPVDTEHLSLSGGYHLKNLVSKSALELASKYDEKMKVPYHWFSILDSLTRNVNVHSSTGHKFVKKYLATVPKRPTPRRFKCKKCSSVMSTFKNELLYYSVIANEYLSQPCYDGLVRSAMDNERINPNFIVLSRFYRECTKFRMPTSEVKKMLKFFVQHRFVLYSSTSRTLARHIILKPDWLFKNISKIVLDENILSQGRDYKIQYENLKKLSLEADFKTLVNKGIASLDLLNYAWGKKSKFFLSMLMENKVMDNWKINSDQHYILFDMIKTVPKDEFFKRIMSIDKKFLKQKKGRNLETATARFTFKVHQNFEGKVNLFRKLVCLSVDQCRTLQVEDVQPPGPELVQNTARIYLLEKSPVFIEQVSDMAIDFKVYHTEKSADVVLHRVEAILRQLNTESLESSLSWSIVLSKKGSKKFVPIEKALEQKFPPWSDGKTDATSARNNSTAIDQVDLDGFLDM